MRPLQPYHRLLREYCETHGMAAMTDRLIRVSGAPPPPPGNATAPDAKGKGKKSNAQGAGKAKKARRMVLNHLF